MDGSVEMCHGGGGVLGRLNVSCVLWRRGAKPMREEHKLESMRVTCITKLPAVVGFLLVKQGSSLGGVGVWWGYNTQLRGCTASVLFPFRQPVCMDRT